MRVGEGPYGAEARPGLARSLLARGLCKTEKDLPSEPKPGWLRETQ